jgi:hypothetical protein
MSMFDGPCPHGKPSEFDCNTCTTAPGDVLPNATKGSSNEARYFDALRRIAKDYLPAERILRDGQKLYGVDGEEALVMSYQNIQDEAAAAIRGRRRPRVR